VTEVRTALYLFIYLFIWAHSIRIAYRLSGGQAAANYQPASSGTHLGCSWVTSRRPKNAGLDYKHSTRIKYIQDNKAANTVNKHAHRWPFAHFCDFLQSSVFCCSFYSCFATCVRSMWLALPFTLMSYRAALVGIFVVMLFLISVVL